MSLNAVLCLVTQTLYDPMDGSPPGSPFFPGKNTGVGGHALLQGTFPTQGSNPGLLHCRGILYCLSYQGSPRILERVAYPFSRGSSSPKNKIGVSCTAGGFFTSSATREALLFGHYWTKLIKNCPYFYFWLNITQNWIPVDISELSTGHWLGWVDSLGKTGSPSEPELILRETSLWGPKKHRPPRNPMCPELCYFLVLGNNFL